MTLSKILANIRGAAYLVGVILIIWLYKDYQYQKIENVRQTENARQLRQADSLRFMQQNLTAKEIEEYLKYQNPSLKNKLDRDNIKLNRIESLVSQDLAYRDSISKAIDLSGLLADIKNKIPNRTPFEDTTKCLKTKGYIEYKDDSLTVVFTDRSFNNKSDAVVYWQRREWKILGFKTRFLGKKEFTSKNYTDCGDIKIQKIEKVKK
jgi:hypothetical protein